MSGRLASAAAMTEPYTNLRPIGRIECCSCKNMFEPKIGGYNARYCSDTCKRHNQRRRLKANNPTQLVDARRRSYLTTKAHPGRLDKHRRQGLTYRQLVHKWLADYKISRGCVDCGYRGHFSALQLDHEGKKSVEIGDARSSIRRLKEEIDAGQCKVRCANCHSIRTWERKQANKIVPVCEAIPKAA